MKILITGATGLLGGKLVEVLSKKYSVYAIVRDISRFKIPRKNVTLIQADLCKYNVETLPGDIEVIYYLAQSRRFREFPEEAIDIFKINIDTPLKFVDWAIKNNVKKFFYTSSGGVYKNPTQPVKEFFDINANEKNGFYLDSKLSAEILLKNYADYFETFAILRPFFVYGPRQHESMLIPRLIKNIFDGKEVVLSGPDGIKINPIYVDDAAQAFENLLTLKGEFIFNIAGNEVISIKKLSELISDVTNKKPVFKYVEARQFDLIADVSLMKELLHIPKVDLPRGLTKTYDYLCRKQEENEKDNNR